MCLWGERREKEAMHLRENMTEELEGAMRRVKIM